MTESQPQYGSLASVAVHCDTEKRNYSNDDGNNNNNNNNSNNNNNNNSDDRMNDFWIESQRLVPSQHCDNNDENDNANDDISSLPTANNNSTAATNTSSRSKRNALVAISLCLCLSASVGIGIGVLGSIGVNHRSDKRAFAGGSDLSPMDAYADADASLVGGSIRAPTAALDPSASGGSGNGNGNNDDDDEEEEAFRTSPFFEHVLEWKQLDLADSPENRGDDDYDYDDNQNNHKKSNHYRGALEFCSDPERGLYAYGPVGNCVPGKPAPLIVMKPKRFYHLTLVNNAHIDTNLHTHGLHVSGVGTVDDVTRVAEPGKCLEYEYYILDDADVGTFWYHPHRHPLVTPCAFGGAYGMLIVEETVRDYYPKHLEHFLKRNQVLLQFSSMYDKKHRLGEGRSNRVNGLDFLDLTLRADAWYYVRVSSVVYAESVNYVEWENYEKKNDDDGDHRSNNGDDACDVRVVAYDGVYRSEIPGPKQTKNRNHNAKHMMTVSSRGDFAVKCTGDATIHFHQGQKSEESKLVRIRVVSSSLPEEEEDAHASASSGSSNVTHVALPAVLPSSPFWDAHRSTPWKPRRPYYMPDLSDHRASSTSTVVDEYWHVSLDDYFANGTEGVSVNQRVWDPDRPIRTFDLGQLVEYTIWLSQTHPYHAHINRMQIVQPGGCGGRFEEGEYFDTVVQVDDDDNDDNDDENDTGCRVRVKFFDFAGRVVIHCHRFNHEDQGMMTWIDVLGGHGHEIKAAPQTTCEAVL